MSITKAVIITIATYEIIRPGLIRARGALLRRLWAWEAERERRNTQ